MGMNRLAGLLLALFIFFVFFPGCGGGTGGSGGMTSTGTNPGPGQRTVRGTLRTQEGQPLPGVEVELEDTGEIVFTDEQGNFIFLSDLADNDLEFLFEFESFEDELPVQNLAAGAQNIEIICEFDDEEGEIDLIDVDSEFDDGEFEDDEFDDDDFDDEELEEEFEEEGEALEEEFEEEFE